MTFDRWKSPWPRTWPYALFKKHHTELNNLYWSNAAAKYHAMYLTKKAADGDKIDSTLAFPPANSHRINCSILEWKSRLKEFENWNRLNALMALTGYMETYLHAIVKLALTSDPGILISSSRVVDGIGLVKKSNLPDFDVHLRSITKGTWNDRLQCYMQLFKSAPTALINNINELEAIRKLRNGVGHAFGREIDDYRSPLILKPIPLQRLSEQRLQKWLGLVETIVSEIEEQLRTNHIGAIEVLLNYHFWDKKYPAGHTSEEKAFRAKFPDAQGSPPSATYFREAIKYYTKS
jgi:hypothetical protein